MAHSYGLLAHGLLARLTGLIALSLLTACSSGQKRFEYMTDAELLAYNRELPLTEQVICERRPHTSSRIRKKICKTVREIATEKTEAYRQLEVINVGVGTGSFGRVR